MMSSSLFQEALADAKQLREVAEQNAKNAVIDAVTPKIRRFIEEQLLESSGRRLSEDSPFEPTDFEPDGSTGIDLDTDGDLPLPGDDFFAADDGDEEEAGVEIEERANLMRAMTRIAESLSPEESASLIPVVERMRAASRGTGSSGIRREVPSDVRFTHIVKENAEMQDKKKVYEVDLDELMSDETDDMGSENEGYGMDDEGMYMEDEAMHPAHAEDEGMMGHEDEMSDLYESLAALLEAEGEDDDVPVDDGEEGGGGGGGMPDDGEGTDLPAALEDRLSHIEDMLTQAIQLLGSEGREEGGEDEGGEDESAMGDEEEAAPAAAPAARSKPPGAMDETLYSVNESVLLRELDRLRSIREGRANLGTGNTPAKKSGVAAGSKFISEKTKALGTGNTAAARKGVAAQSKFLAEEAPEEEGHDLYEEEEMMMPKHSKEGKKIVKGMKPETSKVMAENRDLKVSLSKHSEAIETLRGQLTEMNLFNAKLLYVNRLLQDRDLTDAQRRNIIESLDRARSLREVKLLYKGLSESINRGRGRVPAKSQLVNESATRPVSPTSRPLSTSGVSMNEAVEVHRWSILAGINKA